MGASDRLLHTLGLLTDAELEAEVVRLATVERKATAALVAHLAELHDRRLDERAGFSSAKRKYALASHPRDVKPEVADPISVRRVADDAFRSGTTDGYR